MFTLIPARWKPRSRNPEFVKAAPPRQFAPIVDLRPLIPFHLVTCTMLETARPEEQAELDACVHVNPTIQDFWRNATQADWMLDALRRYWERIPSTPERELRTFALRCVSGFLERDTAAALLRLVDVARARADGRATLDEMRSAQEALREDAIAAGMQGLIRLLPEAASILAIWHCADRSPYEAAFWAANFAARHDAFIAVRQAAQSWWEAGESRRAAADQWLAAYFHSEHPEVFRQATKAARGRQVPLLREILPDPFRSFHVSPGGPN